MSCVICQVSDTCHTQKNLINLIDLLSTGPTPSSYIAMPRQYLNTEPRFYSILSVNYILPSIFVMNGTLYLSSVC